MTYFFMSQEYIYNLIFIFSITRDIIDAVKNNHNLIMIEKSYFIIKTINRYRSKQLVTNKFMFLDLFIFICTQYKRL